MRIEAMLALPLLCAALAACQQGATITITQEAGHVRFEVTRMPPEKPTCIRDLAVYAGKPDGGTPLWHIVADAQAPCVRKVELGQVPQGFTPDDGVQPPEVQAGRSYHVEASGTGWLAFEAFTAR